METVGCVSPCPSGLPEALEVLEPFQVLELIVARCRWSFEAEGPPELPYRLHTWTSVAWRGVAWRGAAGGRGLPPVSIPRASAGESDEAFVR